MNLISIVLWNSADKPNTWVVGLAPRVLWYSDNVFVCASADENNVMLNLYYSFIISF